MNSITEAFQSKRVALSPWARAALSLKDQADLEERAEKAGCYVSTVKRGDGRWMARAFSRSSEIRAQFIGHSCETAVSGAIEKFEAQLYTAEELVIIAAQSGIGVRRA